MFMPIPIPAAVVRRQHRIVAAFRAAGAIARDRATTAAALALDEGMAFRLLCSHAVLRQAGESRFYLDEPSWAAHRAKLRRTALTVLGVFLLLAIAGIVWGITR